jgi:hypothetical protein
MNANRLALLFLGLGIAPLAGCGGEKQGEVTGTVMLKNQPLASGVVTFFPENGTPVAAFVENGSYTIPGIVYGNHRIAVTPRAEVQEVTTGGAGRPLKPGEVDPAAKAASAPKKPPGPPIPDKYRSADTSNLKCTVDQPKVTHPIALD